MKKTIISELQLEQLVLGELSSPEEARVREIIAIDSEVKSRFETILRTNESLLEEYPPAAVQLEVEKRLREVQPPLPIENERSSFAGLLFSLRWGALAACALALIVFVVPLQEEPPGFRVKGMQAHLVAHRIAGENAQLLPPDSRVSEGDRIQLSIVGGEDLFAVVFSLDGEGTVTLHYPREEDHSEKLVERSMSLPTSYELDDAPRFERFFLVTHAEPLNASDVLKLAHDLVGVADESERGLLHGLPDGSTQSSFLLRKIP